MDRVAMILLVGFASCGCARDQANLPPRAIRQPDLLPVEVAPAPPTATSLDRGKIPKDPSTVRASFTPAAEAEVAVVQAPSDPPPPPSRSLPPRSGPTSSPAPAQGLPPLPVASDPPPSAPPAAARMPDPVPLRTSPNLAPGTEAVITAAVVGGTIITYRELKAALLRDYSCKPQDLEQIPKDQLNMMAQDTLNRLIDRALILQEAQKDMSKKDNTKWTMFREAIEKSWHEREVPPMCKAEKVADEFALAKTLEARGESLTDLKLAFLEKTMADEVVMMRIRDKVERPGLHDKQAYYESHKAEPEYHRDPKVAWREVFLPAATPDLKAAARKKAEALRARLAAGEDFAKLARAESKGVTAGTGGVWETAPDGHAVPAINAALQSLEPGRVGPPLEGPKGVYLVRVDSRSKGGIAPFPEVQHEIGKKIFEQRFVDQITAYLKKLRERTAITSPLFEGLSTVPRMADQAAKKDNEATRTSRP